MKKDNIYSSEFYQTHVNGSKISAQEILPVLIELINPKSVIDVGCGVAPWLSVLIENGISDVVGVDGDYVDMNLLEIPKDQFIKYDLSQPFNYHKKFDLAMSLEVGEHINKQSARIFVETLTNLSNVVLFSAAVPLQGGASHVNEQWQEYWAALFKERGFIPVDCLRKKIWNNQKIEFWYIQNAIIYVLQDSLINYPKLQEEFLKNPEPLLSVIHPRFYLYRSNPNNYYLSDIIKSFPQAFSKMLKRKLKI